MLKRFLNNPFIRSSFIFGIANFLVSFIAYVDNLLVAKNLTLAEYGEYTTALAYMVFFGVPLTAFGLIVIERIGRADASEREQVALSIEKWLQKELISTAPLWIIVTILLAFGMYFKGNMSMMAVAFVLICSFLGIFINFYMGVLQSYKSFGALGVLNTVGALVKLLLYIVVVIFRPTLFWLFTAFIASTLFGFVTGRKLIRKKDSVKTLNIQFDKAFKYIKKRSVLVPLLTTLGIVGLSNVDIVLVKKFFADDVSGLYGSLSVLGKIIFYAVTPLSAVGFTFFTGKDTKDQSNKILGLVAGLIALAGISLTVFYYFFPVFVINFVFNEKFLKVAQIIWLAGLFGTVHSLMYIFAQYFVAIKSRFAFVGILAVAIQVIAIYIAHNSLYEILVINIVVNGGLALVYMAEIFRRAFYSQSKAW